MVKSILSRQENLLKDKIWENPGFGKDNIEIKAIKDFEIHYKQNILPIAKKEWYFLYKKAEMIRNSVSKQFTKKFLKKKIFHPLGASIYAVSVPQNYFKKVIKLCIGFQIMADLLDSESERKETNPKLVRQLHSFLRDFIECGRFIKKHYPAKEKLLVDINYLKSLVKIGRELNTLPGFSIIKPYLINSVREYSKAQLHSSMPLRMRDKANKRWATKSQAEKLGYRWFEYYMSHASTLPIFALIALCTKKNINSNEVKSIHQKYYAWFSMLHILLNHLQGLEEDLKDRTTNYVSYYGNKYILKKRIAEILRKAKTDLQNLPNNNFYLFVLFTLIKEYSKRISKFPQIMKSIRTEIKYD